jgi:DNA-binding transcriptional LysR family regulator
MPFDIRQLRYVIAAADHRSFHRAAEVFQVKPSTLSRSILRLEHCLRAELFTRTPSGVSMTAVGKDFVGEARQLVSRVDRLVTSIRTAGQGRIGDLVIGHNSPLSAGNLRATLFDFRDKFPTVEFNGVEAQHDDLVSGIREGQIDIAITASETRYPGLSRASFWSERLLIAMPAGHELASRELLHWADLQQETFLLSANDLGPKFHDMLLGRLSGFGSRPKVKMQAVSRDTIMSLLGGGLGVSVICEAGAGAQYPNVVLREVHDAHGLCMVGYSGYWRQDNTNPALRSFLSFIRNRYSMIFDLS